MDAPCVAGGKVLSGVRTLLSMNEATCENING